MGNLNVIKNRYFYSDDRKSCALPQVYETDIDDHAADLGWLIQTVEQQQQEIEEGERIRDKQVDYLVRNGEKLPVVGNQPFTLITKKLCSSYSRITHNG